MFSSRLPWSATAGLNRLAAAEQARRAAGQEVLDLTASNPTAVGLGVSAETLADALASALADPTAARYVPAPLGPPAARAAVAREYARLGATVDPAAHRAQRQLQRILRLAVQAARRTRATWCWCPSRATRCSGTWPGWRPLRCGRIRCGSPVASGTSTGPALELEGARAIVVVNPNNPTGSFLRRDEWERLARLAGERDIAVIVDEVFADYPLAPPPDALRTVAAAPRSPALTFALGGLSKSCGLPQMKLGWMCVLGPAAQVDEALSRLELIADTYLSVGAPVLAALPRLLAIGTDVRAGIQARLRAQPGSAWPRPCVDPAPPCCRSRAAGRPSSASPPPAATRTGRWRCWKSDGVLVQPGYFFDLERRRRDAGDQLADAAGDPRGRDRSPVAAAGLTRT